MPRDVRQRAACWALIIGGHVLLLLLISRDHARHFRLDETGPDERSELFFFELPVLTERSDTPEEPENVPLGVVSPQVVESAAPPSIAIPSEAPSPAAPVDWFAEAEKVARATGERIGQPGPRVFGQVPKSPWQKCEKKKSSFQWDPEPKAAGFIGIFPYVRLGKRCVVSLGFFGCALGELPPPNSQLFADMHDPDRPVSSVPDNIDCIP